MNAKYLHSAGQPLEAQIRVQLTHQALDKAIWLMGTADDETALDEAGSVAQASEVIKNRKNLTIKMSDQVPLWAKAATPLTP